MQEMVSRSWALKDVKPLGFLLTNQMMHMIQLIVIDNLYMTLTMALG
jgi:hypothetical protein